MKKQLWKHKFQKMMALCLTFIMILAMGLTTMAAELAADSTGTLTVNGLEEGVSVTAYKIIDVNIENGSPKDPVYKWTTDVQQWVQNKYPDYIGNDRAVSDTFLGLKDNADELKTFNHALAAAIKDGTVTIPEGNQKTENAVESAGQYSAVFEDMPIGMYLLTATGGKKIYTPTTQYILFEESNGEWVVKDETVAMKGAEPSIEKTVTAGTTVAVGDTVEYELTVTVPEYPLDAKYVTLAVGDKLGEGLTLNTNSIKVTCDGNEINAEGNYTLTAADDHSFQIDFDESFIQNHAGHTGLKVTYTATVNEHAFEDGALNNKAAMIYHDPYDKDKTIKKDVDKEVYTYGINIDKVDASGAALAGAEFQLKDKDDAVLKFTMVSEGVYRYDPAGDVETLTVNDQGRLELQGLNVGTYRLYETKAPAGYVLPKDGSYVVIVLTDAEPDGTLDNGTKATAEGGIQLKENPTMAKNILTVKVVNTKNGQGFTLPKTGGMGTMLFTVAGIALMAGAVVIFAVSRKKKTQQ